MRIPVLILLLAASMPPRADANVLTINADAFAASTSSSRDSAEAAVIADTDQATSDAFDFLSLYSDGYHNEYYRYKAIREATKGDWRHAANLFEIAARYGDKYSQHRLSLMYWHGVGVTRDPVEAYVWADMAAERGYPVFLAIREKLWGELTDEQKVEVPSRGVKRYAIYGDDVALPKFRGIVAKKRAQVTGSHAGHANNLTLRSGIPMPMWRLDADEYIARTDIAWKRGHVEVGDIESDQSESDDTAPTPEAP